MKENNKEDSREISSFSKQTGEKTDIYELQEIKGRLELAMGLSNDRTRKAILHIKINLVKARVNSLLRLTNK